MKKARSSNLSLHALKRLRRVKTADLLVGIPSFNNAHTINYVVHQAAHGLETYFPDMKSVIFVSDGNSIDGTLTTVKAMRLPFHTTIIPTTYVGVSGKGSAVKAVFEAAMILKASGVALVDSDLRSITPEWIKLLISPILEGVGFVTPLYVRHKYDGSITKFLCYPLTASLYGKKVRQPIGGDFGLSLELVEELLESPLWQTPFVPRFGIDIFETQSALAKRFNVKQAFLKLKTHEAKDPSKHLAPMFRQVAGSMLTCVQEYENAWRGTRGLDEVEIVGEEKYEVAPEPVHVGLQNLIKTCRKGFVNKRIYLRILGKDLFKEVEGLRKAKDADLVFPSETWAKAVYSFAAGFGREKQLEKKKRLLEALRILWLGKVSAFVKETLELDTLEAEERVEEEVRTFERLKPLLLELFH